MKSPMKRCDDLWARIVKDRAGNVCERCGSVKRVSAHHIIPRTCFTLRHDLENGVALCYYHHIGGRNAAHKDALGFSQWISERRDVNYLNGRRHSQTKQDYKLIEIYLIQKLEGI